MIAETLDGPHRWEAASLEETFRKLCETVGWKPKELFTVLRLAATASNATPPLFDTLAVLGKARTQARVRAILKLLATT